MIPNVGNREVPADPNIEHLDSQAADRLTWSAPGRPGVTLYRPIGARHGWPGFRQYMPAWLMGRIPQDFDATAVALEFAGQSGRRQAVE